MTMVFNTKFEVEEFDRMNRQFQVIHILIQELDTVLEDKLEDKDNGVNTHSIQFGLLRAKLVFQLRLLLQYIYIYIYCQKIEEEEERSRVMTIGLSHVVVGEAASEAYF